MKSQLLPLPLSSRRSILLPILSALLLLLVWSPPQTVEARVGNSDSNWNSNSNSNSNWNVRAENAIGSSRRAHPQGQTSPAAKADATAATATTAADSRMEFGFARVLEQSVLSIRHQSRGRGIGRSNSNSSNDKMNKNDKTSNDKTSKNNNNKSDARRRLAQKWARDEDGKILWWIWVVIGCSIALCCLFCCCTSVCCLRD